MRKIVVTEFVSLDGVIEDPGGAEGTDFGGWTFKFNDPAGMKYKLDEVLRPRRPAAGARHLRGVRRGVARR